LKEIARGQLPSLVSREISAGCDAELPHEGTGHMALVRKTGTLRGIRYCLSVQEKLPRQANPALNEVSMRRRTQLASECAHDLVATDARKRRQFR
jgi:hypothetical protein